MKKAKDIYDQMLLGGELKVTLTEDFRNDVSYYILKSPEHMTFSDNPGDGIRGIKHILDYIDDIILGNFSDVKEYEVCFKNKTKQDINELLNENKNS